MAYDATPVPSIYCLSYKSPQKNFVRPICNEQGVGDRTAYGHIVTLLSSVMVYVAVFLWFAVGAARRHALYVLVPVVFVSLLLTILVATKVIWGSSVVATTAAFVSYIFIGFDVWEAIQDANNMDPLFEVILGLVNACASTIFGFLSSPMDLYTAIPNALGVPVLVAQLLAYFIHGNPPQAEQVPAELPQPDHEA